MVWHDFKNKILFCEWGFSGWWNVSLDSAAVLDAVRHVHAQSLLCIALKPEGLNQDLLERF